MAHMALVSWDLRCPYPLLEISAIIEPAAYASSDLWMVAHLWTATDHGNASPLASISHRVPLVGASTSSVGQVDGAYSSRRLSQNAAWTAKL
jgi:hypothetical protein